MLKKCLCNKYTILFTSMLILGFLIGFGYTFFSSRQADTSTGAGTEYSNQSEQNSHNGKEEVQGQGD